MRITRSKALRLLDLPAEIFEHHIIPALDYPHRYALSAVNRFFRGLLQGRLFRGRGKVYGCPIADEDEKVFYTDGHWHMFGRTNIVHTSTSSLFVWNMSQSRARRIPCPYLSNYVTGVSSTGKYIWMRNVYTRSLSICDVRRKGRIVHTVADSDFTPFRWFNDDRHFSMAHKCTDTGGIRVMMHTVDPSRKTTETVLCATFPPTSPTFKWLKKVAMASRRPWFRSDLPECRAVTIVPDSNTPSSGLSIQCVATNHPLVDTLWAATYDHRYFLITERGTDTVSVYDVDSKTVVARYDSMPGGGITFVATSPVAYEFAVGTWAGAVLMVRRIVVLAFGLRPSAHLHHLRTQRLEGTTLTPYYTQSELTACDHFKWHPTVAGLYAIRSFYHEKAIIWHRDTKLGSVQLDGNYFKWAPDGSSLAVYGCNTITIYE
jgi:hypothetical protein